MIIKDKIKLNSFIAVIFIVTKFPTGGVTFFPSQGLDLNGSVLAAA